MQLAILTSVPFLWCKQECLELIIDLDLFQRGSLDGTISDIHQTSSNLHGIRHLNPTERAGNSMQQRLNPIYDLQQLKNG
jgi:hypothetical protein